MADQSKWRFWIDTGGTFTDCLGTSPGGVEHRLKVLSTGAVRARIKHLLPETRVVLGGVPPVGDGFYRDFEVLSVAKQKVARVVDWDAERSVATLSGPDHGLVPGAIVDLSAGEEAPVLAMRILAGVDLARTFPTCSLRIATTRGTNALLEGRTATCAFLVTAGFADLLQIGDQRRRDLFAVNPSKPPALHGPVLEVPERLAADGTVLRAVDLEALRGPATQLLQEGIRVAAVALLHSYRNPAHELAVANFLRQLGFAHVSVSSELAALIKIVPRAATAVVDAILSPIMDDYLDRVGRCVGSGGFHVMSSAGGLVHRTAYRAKDSLLSGPAGGVVGAAAVARRAGIGRFIGFDMGGTSTDVARFEGDYDYRFEHTVGPARVYAPALRLETVAAGGGSICRFDGSALVVGPESAGADPGPACYGGRGPLTLTDVNLLLSRLSPELFGVPVFPEAAESRLAEVAESVAVATGQTPGREELLTGFLAIADERMADTIRRISVQEGYDPADYTLVTFGGAGGLHACAVAERLGIRQVLFPADSGLLSALGLREAVSERFAERQVLRPLTEMEPRIADLLEELTQEAFRLLSADGVVPAQTIRRRSELELRLTGQDASLTLDTLPIDTIGSRFLSAYKSRYGYAPERASVEVVTLRVVASELPTPWVEERFEDHASAGAREGRTPFSATASLNRTTGGGVPMLTARGSLKAGAGLTGPAVVQDSFSTLYVAGGWKARVGTAGSIRLRREAQQPLLATMTRPEVVELELYTCRFMSLVEEMGVLLQRCAVSVNVKERLDFSCALLDAGGQLVANAPHIPVHLGALGMCVRAVRETISLEPGDVAVTNHPAFGGSHLPDVTLVAPVHGPDGSLIGYVANRAHHAEIGGMRPGSMPPDARCLAQEGVVIPPMHLVRGGQTCWKAVEQRLSGGPYPSRAVPDNVADLHAQLAAIRRGADALVELVSKAGRETVHRFMRLLQTRSAEALGDTLIRVGSASLKAADALDDGTPVVVSCRVAPGRVIVDFGGSGDVHPGNLNATPAITHSAVLYVLRLLAGRELPLNEGLLRDVRIIIPTGILSPSFSQRVEECPAVVGGNVETSQRIVDVLLQAFGVAACSQGTMNNVTFGNERFSCYETIGGGAGACAMADGCSAVQIHMTNTAITDPEIMETRLPVRLEQFAIRAASGGAGLHRGGDGIVRRLRFLEAAELSVLTQRRVHGPPGLEGGRAGKPGMQWVVRKDGQRETLSSIAATRVGQGDTLTLETPGGGGWGEPAD